MQEIGVVALLGRRHAEGVEALEGVVLGIDAVAPAFVAEGRIGDDVIKGLERAVHEELGIGEGVANQAEAIAFFQRELLLRRRGLEEDERERQKKKETFHYN